MDIADRVAYITKHPDRDKPEFPTVTLPRLRMGESATDKRDRQRLLNDHTGNESPPPVGLPPGTIVLGPAYPPSILSLSELKPISISALKLETRHHGRCLFGRTISKAKYTTAIAAVIEDTDGQTDRLTIHFMTPLIDVEDFIPEGAVFAIKEPVYRERTSGDYNIRIDHISDLIFLTPEMPLFPAQFLQGTSASHSTVQDFKDKGNAYFKARQLHQALESYSRGIDACKEQNTLLLADLYRNRAQVNLLLGRYEPAIDDAHLAAIDEGLTSEDSNLQVLNAKALFRAGRACYELGDYEKAWQYFSRALQSSPDDVDCMSELQRTTARQNEARHCHFDFVRLQAAGNRRHDLASFTNYAEVRSAGSRGRGLFAAKTFKAGDLILVEKAFGMALHGDPGIKDGVLGNTNTIRGSTGLRTALWYSVLDKLQHNPVMAAEFSQRYDGGYEPKYAPSRVDGRTVIDCFRVMAIIELNSFPIESIKNKKVSTHGVGIWLTTSYGNHSCTGNAERIVLGDIMTLRAKCDIAQGDEIFTSYTHRPSNRAFTRACLQAGWQFNCACKLCSADGRTPQTQLQERETLRQEALTLMNSHPVVVGQKLPRNIINLMEAFVSGLTASYNEYAFHNLPRPALIVPTAWLANAYVGNAVDPFGRGAEGRHCKAACMQILRNAGFFITISTTSITIDRDNCIVNNYVVCAAFYLRFMYQFERPLISKAFLELARCCHELVSGNLQEFDDMETQARQVSEHRLAQDMTAELFRAVATGSYGIMY